ncbi:MAG: hypothetical protein NUW09_09470 [Deltaproteobacteria bacterium]|nr:hypothetical protein [Deltaproteobacteria bacterium]
MKKSILIIKKIPRLDAGNSTSKELYDSNSLAMLVKIFAFVLGSAVLAAALPHTAMPPF